METSKDPYDAFYRNDGFGLCGKAPKPIYVTALFFFSILWIPIKLVLAFLWIIIGVTICKLSKYLPAQYGPKLAGETVRFFAKLLLFSLGWNVSWKQLPTESLSFQDRFQKDGPPAFGAFVCNHSSWTDVIFLLAKFHISFIARKGTESLPLVGIISQTLKCIYVDREPTANGGNGNSNGGDAGASGAAVEMALSESTSAGAPRGGNVAAIRQRLVARYAQDCEKRKRRQSSATVAPEPTTRPSAENAAAADSAGFGNGWLPHLLVFPEATTTNNRYMLPFKRGVFVPGVPVRILIFKYKNSLGGMFSPCWEAIDIKWHLFYTLAIPFHSITCYEGPVYQPNPEEVRDPALFAQNVRKVMMEAGAFTSSSATFESKKVYHGMLGLTKQKLAAVADTTAAVQVNGSGAAKGDASKKQAINSATQGR